MLSGKWTATSTYDIYMVGTPDPNNNNGGGGNDDGNPDDDADEPQSDLGPEDQDILNESLDSLNHDALRLQFARTAKKITNQK